MNPRPTQQAPRRRPALRGVGLWTITLSAAALAASCDSETEPDPFSVPVCAHGEVACSADATELRYCAAGQWLTTYCLQDQLQLCEAGQCVDPWRYDSPPWGKCEWDLKGTAESLRQKAEGYEAIAKRLHVHPELRWLAGVILPCQPGDCSEPAVPEAEATYQDVEQWQSGENDGLWSALYLTAEAYRYAVTGEPEALDMIKVLLAGQQARMAVTGVPGVYTRQMIPPGVEGLSCPTDLSMYVPDAEKDDNMWVQIGSDGCVQVVNPTTMQFESTSHCGLDSFAGWCWLDNVSQDEYSGHMLAHAAIAKLVDDPDVQAINAELLAQIGQHLMDNQLQVVDWDGRPTEHGQLWPVEWLSGYAAAMSWAFVKTVAVGTGDPEVQAFLDDCLLTAHEDGDRCIEANGAATTAYDELIGEAALYMGCMSNWNNFSMHMLSLHTLLMLEQDPSYRATIQAALTDDLWNGRDPNEDRPLVEQNNAMYDFMFAAGKALGPDSDGPAFYAVENGICMLRQFPASEHLREVECPADQCVEVCKDRKDKPMTDYPRPMADRCLGTFVWWNSPYTTTECTEDKRNIKPPADYLLPYWMGRYYGFIDATM